MEDPDCPAQISALNQPDWSSSELAAQCPIREQREELWETAWSTGSMGQDGAVVSTAASTLATSESGPTSVSEIPLSPPRDARRILPLRRRNASSSSSSSLYSAYPDSAGPPPTSSFAESVLPPSSVASYSFQVQPAGDVMDTPAATEPLPTASSSSEPCVGQYIPPPVPEIRTPAVSQPQGLPQIPPMAVAIPLLGSAVALRDPVDSILSTVLSHVNLYRGSSIDDIAAQVASITSVAPFGRLL